jgi:superfamily I DNA/RNA helicase
VPESAGRHGELPRLARLANVQSEFDFIVQQARELHGHGLAWRDVAVLFRVNRDGERIAEYLAKAGIPVNLFGKSVEHRRFRPADDSVKLMTFHSSKGLEFPVVFIPFLEALPYMKDDVAGEAKLLYVAMTRAMERLILTHHGDSPFVAEMTDALAQGAAAGALRRRRPVARGFGNPGL